MKLFLDSAEMKEIEEASLSGLIDGVTTNPSLVAKAGMPFESLIESICKKVDGPISAEVTALDAPGMIEQGKKLAALHRNVVVKIPLTGEGIKATKKLSELSIRTNVTLCFSPIQALMAAKVGATYISPFVGRLDDIAHPGMDLIADICKIYQNYGMKTQVLVASVRHLEHLLQAARMGAHVATIPYKVYQQLLKHPLTDQGLAQFMKDWESAKK